jgi:hypothetical protein
MSRVFLIDVLIGVHLSCLLTDGMSERLEFQSQRRLEWRRPNAGRLKVPASRQPNHIRIS